MTNEKLGVLLVDVPEPKCWEYTFLVNPLGSFILRESNKLFDVLIYAYKCTQEEAKKYPQFRWVALEELE
ncbi:hypothetical protein [Streptococcus suis]|uniref:Uncharacterized protein n=1 Tax=Streptococcus suis TaxID=1307 RepID=A0A0Z8KV79_STRSU|nr:hypothetical protein [Streptococcus suis]MBY5027556.1 hypothetical protein [Streptococcus suis]NQG42609.1 hypothetical protein [Streptococcus suis]NQG72680.1 hypothetical protein [Streptococcus suis]NQH22523.1 hypothetical protein [Streptococcus suis]NQN39151.1 hypothetical protein [Streptococcus suis]